MDEEDRIEIFGVKDFLKLDIKTVAANMHCYYLTYSPKELEVCLDYVVSDLEHYYDMRLCVNMDKELNITGFMAILD
jgi:hypothetical protein